VSLAPVLPSLAGLASTDRPAHLALGMFDGVHLGHARVISSSIEWARKDGGVAVVLTFPDHPSQLLAPNAPTPLIMSPETKAANLLELGADHVVLQIFDLAFSQIEATSFVSQLKAMVPTLQSLHVGKNFRFGHGRAGDADFLASTATDIGLEVQIADPVEFESEPISSSRIRVALAQGDITSVNHMLGRCYEAAGEVTKGDGRGIQLGFPTLNLPWHPGAPPRHGVYAVELTSRDSGQSWPGVANYGVRPTFDKEGESPLLETHLLGDSELGPGNLVGVALQTFLRDEVKFDSVDALREQIARDKESARHALGLSA
jgi:riboflavin kinase / FMN adenylyltransferase